MLTNQAEIISALTNPKTESQKTLIKRTFDEISRASTEMIGHYAENEPNMLQVAHQRNNQIQRYITAINV